MTTNYPSRYFNYHLAKSYRMQGRSKTILNGRLICQAKTKIQILKRLRRPNLNSRKSKGNQLQKNLSRVRKKVVNDTSNPYSFIGVCIYFSKYQLEKISYLSNYFFQHHLNKIRTSSRSIATVLI